MPVDILEDEVLNFTSEKLGIARRKIALSSRLSQDLGMDGDDAVEFFEAYQERFRVDLAQLGENWNKHFFPEGLGPSSSFFTVCAVLFTAGTAVGMAVHRVVGKLPSWVVGLSFVVIWCWPMRCWPYRRTKTEKVPILVSQLVQAAKTRQWIEPRIEDSYGSNNRREDRTEAPR